MKHLLLKIQLRKRAVSRTLRQAQAQGLTSKQLLVFIDDFIQVQTPFLEPNSFLLLLQSQSLM